MLRTGEKIREIRMQRGYNQEQLAELANLNRVTIAKYESGKVEPGAQALDRIADALEVTVDELLGRKETVSTDPWDPEEMGAGDQDAQNVRILARGVSKLSPENRQKLLDVARALFAEDFDAEGNKR